ncbi:MAG: hypothetical protein IPG89_21595 [Bacteroidetes bacterium]|nr:hypothetical protein [Bacteroidota bacterium]
MGRSENYDHFFFGDSWEVGASTPPKYPLMQVALVSDNTNINKYDRFEFTVGGHIGDLACSIPVMSGNYFENNYIFVGGANAGDFTVEIKDQDGNVLQTFNTSGEYVVTVLSGIQQVIGNTSTTITQDIID